MAMDANSSRMDGPEEPVSYWEIERYLLGQLDGDAMQAFRGKLAASAELRAKVETMQDLRPARTFADLKALKARREREAWRTNDASRPAAPSGGPVSFWTRLRDFPLFRPRPVFALLVAFAATAGLIRYLDPGSPGGYQAKGGEQTELLIRIGGMEYDPGEMAAARPGDTLAFVYRAPRPTWVWLAYREDGGEVDFFAGADSPVEPWGAATRWTASPRRILLEGEWERQDILVLVSPHPLARERVLDLLAADRLPTRDSVAGLRAFAFRLARRNATP